VFQHGKNCRFVLFIPIAGNIPLGNIASRPAIGQKTKWGLL